MMKQSDEVIMKKIRKYGSAVLSSPVFHAGFSQTHHEITTVSEHILNVTIAALKISRIEHAHGRESDDRVLVISGLCHDLGIIGRHEKYANDYESGQRHAADSLTIAKDLFPEMDEKTEDAIAHHMWPMTKEKPSSREGMILLNADKWCAAAEWMWFLTRYRFGREIKEALLQEQPDTVIARSLCDYGIGSGRIQSDINSRL